MDPSLFRYQWSGVEEIVFDLQGTLRNRISGKDQGLLRELNWAEMGEELRASRRTRNPSLVHQLLLTSDIQTPRTLPANQVDVTVEDHKAPAEFGKFCVGSIRKIRMKFTETLQFCLRLEHCRSPLPES